jgi:hypothetical protein
MAKVPEPSDLTPPLISFPIIQALEHLLDVVVDLLSLPIGEHLEVVGAAAGLLDELIRLQPVAQLQANAGRDNAFRLGFVRWGRIQSTCLKGLRPDRGNRCWS